MARLWDADQRGARRGREVPVNAQIAARAAGISRPLLAATGRAVLVWLAVAMIASTVRPLDTGGLIAVTLVGLAAARQSPLPKTQRFRGCRVFSEGAPAGAVLSLASAFAGTR